MGVVPTVRLQRGAAINSRILPIRVGIRMTGPRSFGYIEGDMRDE